MLKADCAESRTLLALQKAQRRHSSMRSSDLREGGTWTLQQRRKNGAIFLFVQVALVACSLIPTAWLIALGKVLGIIVHAWIGDIRRRTRSHIALGMPQLSEADRHALARCTLQRLGATFAELVASILGRHQPLPRFAAGHLERLQRAVAERRGVILISAHLGNWEAVARALIAEQIPLVALGREPYDPRLMPFYDRLRAGVPMIYRGAKTAPIQMVRALRNQRVLGIPMDLQARVASVDAAFLAYTAATPLGPARLALRTGALVAVVTLAREPGKTEAITCTILPHNDLAPGPADELIMTTRINAELSRRILSMPEAWLWPHERYRRTTASPVSF